MSHRNKVGSQATELGGANCASLRLAGPGGDSNSPVITSSFGRSHSAKPLQGLGLHLTLSMHLFAVVLSLSMLF